MLQGTDWWFPELMGSGGRVGEIGKKVKGKKKIFFK